MTVVPESEIKSSGQPSDVLLFQYFARMDGGGYLPGFLRSGGIEYYFVSEGPRFEGKMTVRYRRVPSHD